MKIPKQKKIRDIIQDRKKNKVKRSYTNNNKPEDEPEKSVYRSKIKYSVFITMMKATLENKKKTENDLCRIIQDWWITAFGLRPFPEEGGSLNDLQIAIRYELMYQGMKENDISMSEKFLKNHNAAVNFEFDNFTENVKMLRRCEKLNEMGDYIIYPKSDSDNEDQKEFTMEKQSIQKTYYLNEEEDDMASKKSKKVAKKAATKPVKKTDKKERKLGGNDLACVLLMENKYTDEEIFNKVVKEYPDFRKDSISKQRFHIRKGRKAKYKVTHPIPRYVRDGSGKLVVAGSIKKEKKEKTSKKTSKKASKKTGKKK